MSKNDHFSINDKNPILLKIFKESQQKNTCREPLRNSGFFASTGELKRLGEGIKGKGSPCECSARYGSHVADCYEVLLDNLELLVSTFYQALAQSSGEEGCEITDVLQNEMKIMKLLIKVVNNMILSKDPASLNVDAYYDHVSKSDCKHKQAVSRFTANFIKRIFVDQGNLWMIFLDMDANNNAQPLHPSASQLLSTLLIFTNNFISNYSLEYDPDGAIKDITPMLITFASSSASSAAGNTVLFEDLQVDLAISILTGLCSNDCFPWILSPYNSFPLFQSVFSLQVLEHSIQSRYTETPKVKSHGFENSLKCVAEMLHVCLRDFKMHFDPSLHSATQFLSNEYCKEHIVVDSALLISGILQILLIVSEDADGGLFKFRENSGGDVLLLAQNLSALLGHLNLVLPAAVTLKNSGTKQSPGDQDSHPLFKIKVDIIKVISNLSFFSKDYQNQFRDALLYVLDNCLVDDMNPFIREASLFCIRNLTDGNEENQKIIEMLQAKSKPHLYT